MSLPTSPDMSSNSTYIEAGLSREAYTLLAQANLLRMRGRWDDAIKCCMAAMNLAPENATAQSLLGDIYDNRGCIDDAIQWYRMALDVNPESPADKLKLARLLEAKGRLLAMATPIQPHIPLPVTPRAPRPARSSMDPYVWMRALTASALMGLVLVAIALYFVRRPSGDLAAIAAANQLSARPLVLPSPSGAASLPATSPSISVNPTPVNPTPVNVARDPAEISLLNTLQAATLLITAGVTVTDVQIDPRDSRVTLTIVCRPDPTLPDTRELVLRDAQTALAQATQETGSDITQYTIRCLLPLTSLSSTVPSGNGEEPSLVFVGDTTRTALAGYDSTLPLDTTHQQSLYTNPWWLPSLPSPTATPPVAASAPPATP